MIRIAIRVNYDANIREARRYVEKIFKAETKVTSSRYYNWTMDLNITIDQLYETLEQREYDIFDSLVNYLYVAYARTPKTIDYALAFTTRGYKPSIERIQYHYDIVPQIEDAQNLFKGGSKAIYEK